MILCLTLVSVGTYISVKDHGKRLLEYQMAEEEKIKLRGDEGYWVVYRKPEVMSILSHGYDERIGNQVEIYHLISLKPKGYGGLTHGSSSSGFTSID